MRRFNSLLMLLLTVATASLPELAAAAPTRVRSDSTTTSASPAAYCADAEEWALLEQINDYRFDQGLDPVTLSVTLGAAADHHSQSMAAFDYFDASHDLHFEGADRSETVTWQENIAAYGYPDNTHTSRAENLAAGLETAGQVLDQWRTSPSHNEHLLSRTFQAIGIGRATNPGSEYRWYWTVTFGSYVDSVAMKCDDPGSSAGVAAAGSVLQIQRSGRNGSSTDSVVAYDGDETTTWYTTKARIPATGYIWFDFGDTRTLSQIEYLFSSSDGAATFAIQVSNDNADWQTIVELGDPPANTWQSFDWAGETRYVRFYFTNPNQAKALGYLAEVRFTA